MRKILATAIAITVSGSLMAGTLTPTATATVDSTIAFAETTPMDFGTFVASTGVDTAATNCVGATTGTPTASCTDASLVLGLDGNVTVTQGSEANTAATVIHLSGGQAAQLDVTGIAGFSTVKFSSTMLSDANVASSGTATLSHSSGSPSIPDFRLTNLKFDANGDGTADTADTNGDVSGTADGSGNVTLTVGATLYTIAQTADTTYADGAYTGTYDVTVSY